MPREAVTVRDHPNRPRALDVRDPYAVRRVEADQLERDVAGVLDLDPVAAVLMRDRRLRRESRAMRLLPEEWRHPEVGADVRRGAHPRAVADEDRDDPLVAERSHLPVIAAV